ncbi:MAG TPA: histone deacetylase family protein [Bacillota bacterium]|jgi:acetoin utilization deacetylase AcuC-like enzyme|nr:histone deacetylase family protein [Peptococcaceae bacterium MAG4]NLW38524.1 histone deacetylase family protein [Peptococcaceae bacterium]HPU35668.1 histone deacetylase family protein [Bacillota bacterium]HPZ43254.1 histone deacetylase family protein [Bacillota bacterium]HQD75841.1 histone deacetylase family protein [Bacillota bacterium]
MKVVFHEIFRGVYDYDPAAAKGRIDCIYDELIGHYEFVEPAPATESDLLLVHDQSHVNYVKSKGVIYDVALFAAGGAILAAELAVQGEPAFALIRPPGHHASRNSCWGFCWFNNIAIAVAKQRQLGTVKKVAIVDIDLHFGDGTSNIFQDNPDVSYYHLYNLNGLEQFLSINQDCDLVAVSAGFDMHVEDWGLILSTKDYTTIGKMVAEHASKYCSGKFFAVLEGGYNHRVLGKNVKALLEGFDMR